MLNDRLCKLNEAELILEEEDSQPGTLEPFIGLREEAEIREAANAEWFFRGLCEDRTDVAFLREYLASQLRKGLESGAENLDQLEVVGHALDSVR